jgi:multidrug efflux pump subunit AcrA (membrane-fusion protein)
MSEPARASWPVFALGALCVAAITAAALVVGPASGGQAAQTRTIAAQRGVVQQTVSGSGNVTAASQLDLGFDTAGTVRSIYVAEGEHVAAGQLLAELNPQSAEVALEQARASLKAAEATLAQEEEDGGETSGRQSAAGATGAGGSGTGAGGSGTGAGGSGTGAGGSGTGAGGSRGSTATTGSTTAQESAATREANLASARANVKSDRLALQSAEQGLADARLYAPGGGTIVTLSGQVGETVSATGTSKASSASTSSAGGSSTGGAAGSSATGAASRSSSASSASSSSGSSASSSSSAFAVLSDLSSMRLVVPLSESEVGEVRVGQPATVTVEALAGRKLAAHVTAIATLATNNSGVVSYDVTFQLDQMDPGLKPGMSATAEVVVKQAEGVNVPTSAISGGAVTVIADGNSSRRPVVTGLAGDSSTVILSGLNAGEEVALPLSTSTGSSGVTSRLAGRIGGGGLGLGGLGAGAAPGGAIFRRGGGAGG